MNIKKLRDKLKLSQRAFGKRLGVSPQTVLLYEKGQNVPESIQKLIRYEFAEHLPESERLVSEPKDPEYEKSREGEILRLQQRIEELEKLNKELVQDKKDLRDDKKRLLLQLENLTTGEAKNKKPV